MSRADRQMQQCRRKNYQRGSELYLCAAERFETGNSGTHRFYYFPAAHRRSQTHGQCAGKLNPGWNIQRRYLPGAKQCQRDNSHGFLGVIGSVRKSDQRRCTDLGPGKPDA